MALLGGCGGGRGGGAAAAADATDATDAILIACRQILIWHMDRCYIYGSME